MALTTEQVNALVWRYLSESGFEHSAFIFSSEANIEPGDSEDMQIASGALIFFLQRSLLYTTLEKAAKKARRDPDDPSHQNLLRVEERFPDNLPPPVRRLHSSSVQITRETAIILEGHRAGVFACKWSPDGTQLATGSADDTVNLWKFQDGVPTHQEMLGVVPDTQSEKYGIAGIDWSPSGDYFATGSFDTSVCLYQSSGRLVATLCGHRDNVFTVRFNRSGTLLASASADQSAIVWSVPGRSLIKAFPHSGTVMDLDWKDDITFATASEDGTVGIMSNFSWQLLYGHTGHVIAVAWSPGGTYLASGSEDKTVRIWNAEGFKSLVLQGHDSGVSCVKWVPRRENVVVSSAQNGQIRVWDVLNGSCLKSYSRHAGEVVSLSISPDGLYVASGGTGDTIDVTNIVTGEMTVTFRGDSSIELQWDPTGRYIAACLGNGNVAVLPMVQYLT